MYIKNNIVYADAFKYFQHKSKAVVALALPLTAYSPDNIEEVFMDLPLKPVVEKNRIFWQDRKFLIPSEAQDYAGLKTNIIKTRYSEDDQLALMLNKDESIENAELYQKMQDWRSFARALAKIIFPAEK